jgi:hypothetical protein
MGRSQSGGMDFDIERRCLYPVNSRRGWLSEDLRSFLSQFTSGIAQVGGVQPEMF